MLDRATSSSDRTPATSPTPTRIPSSLFWIQIRSGLRRIASQGSSSLTRRIVFLNLTGLVALVCGILYLSQFRTGLIDTRLQSLMVQGEIIATAMASETNSSPSDVLLRRLVSPTQTRARVYDGEGQVILDTMAAKLSSGAVLADGSKSRPSLLERAYAAIAPRLGRQNLPKYEEYKGSEGKRYLEVALALNGQKSSFVRENDHAEAIVSVAVPIQRPGLDRSALLLSTQGSDIDAMVGAERIAIAKVFGIAAAVMIALSLTLASWIAGPVRRLAGAATRVRKRINSRIEIPDFTFRRDEIGDLSGALREMTGALYDRIEGIERFAADVAHELKNPLTSLRSAVETMPLAKSDVSRGRLLDVIQHDVRRLDRLISDISDASRLDAELQRHDAAPVDFLKLLDTIVTVANETKPPNNVSVILKFPGGRRGLTVPGHDSRLGQIVNNLIDNARSFSPDDGNVRVVCERRSDMLRIAVEDDGPGVPEDAAERIFERFYTDRPNHGFGDNSGLGLSISKQIVEAHGGTIAVENRTGPPDAEGVPAVLGARFVVTLPAA